jgi:DNA-binding transcriptional regulator YdaS (Cro superfamily)
MTNLPLARAVEICGSQAALARRIGKKQAHIWNWLNGTVPAEQCVPISRATNGAVTVEDLRPDLAEHWAYLRGTAKKEAA